MGTVGIFAPITQLDQISLAEMPQNEVCPQLLTTATSLWRKRSPELLPQLLRLNITSPGLANSIPAVQNPLHQAQLHSMEKSIMENKILTKVVFFKVLEKVSISLAVSSISLSRINLLMFPQLQLSKAHTGGVRGKKKGKRFCFFERLITVGPNN